MGYLWLFLQGIQRLEHETNHSAEVKDTLDFAFIISNVSMML